MIINIGVIEVVLTLLGFLGSVGVIIWRFSSMQTKQTEGIKANSESIEIIKTTIVELQDRTDSCDLHQANIKNANDNIEKLSKKVSSQASYNINTESTVKVLIERIDNQNTTINKLETSIQALLQLRGLSS